MGRTPSHLAVAVHAARGFPDQPTLPVCVLPYHDYLCGPVDSAQVYFEGEVPRRSSQRESGHDGSRRDSPVRQLNLKFQSGVAAKGSQVFLNFKGERCEGGLISPGELLASEPQRKAQGRSEAVPSKGLPVLGEERRSALLLSDTLAVRVRWKSVSWIEKVAMWAREISSRGSVSFCLQKSNRAYPWRW